MRCTVEVDELAAELDLVARVADKNSTIPILQNVYIEATKGSVTLASTDLLLSLRTSVAAEVETPGKVVVPAAELTALVKTMSGKASLSETKERWLSIECGGSALKVAGLDPADFPELPSAPTDEGCSVPIDQLVSLIRKTLFVVSGRDASQYRWLQLQIAAGRISSASTDGHRIAQAAGAAEGRPDICLYLPANLCQFLVGLKDRVQGEVRISSSENRIFVSAADLVVTCQRQAVEHPPKFEKVLEVPPKYSQAIAALSPLRAALSRAAILGRGGAKDDDGGGAKITIAQDALTIESDSTRGQAVEKVEAQLKGKPGAIGVGIPYLREFLSTVEGDSIVIAFDPGEMQERPPHLWPAGQDTQHYMLAQRRW